MTSTKRKPFKRKKGEGTLRALDLEGKVTQAGGRTGFGLEAAISQSSAGPSEGVYGRRTVAQSRASLTRARLFQTPSTRRPVSTSATASSKRSDHSRRSRFSRASLNQMARNHASPSAAVHIVCAISENLARETCVASLDAGSPISLQVTKQGNGQTYSETLAYLEVLQPDEVLLNEGRRSSQLARKILELYNVTGVRLEPPRELTNRKTQRRRRRFGGASEARHEPDDEEEEQPSDPFGACGTSTVVKFISRSCFDQTKGAELLRKIAREETYDATVVEEYILLSSAHAVLNYTQQSLGASFARNSLYLSVNSGGNNRMAIDRSTLLQLELLVNSKTGKVRDSLIGTIDCTKTTAGSRLLRTNLMSPPTQVDTVNARLELVETFLANEDFFYTVLEHLTCLPDVDKMLSNIALVPRKSTRAEGEGAAKVNQRIASKGISALVCIKSTLAALPALAGALQSQLHAMEAREGNQLTTQGNDDATIMTDRTSLLVGLGGSHPAVQIQRNHLLRAILFAMSQPALTQVLNAVSEIFTETTAFSRNANAMRHQECFALKCEEDGMMSILRKAFLANVDDIYKKADEYAEVYGLQVIVKYTASRGYFVAVPSDVGPDLPPVFLQPAVNGRYINCTTEEITSLNTRAQDNVHDLLLMTHDKIQEVLDVGRTQYDALAALCDAVALLDMCHSFADTVTLDSNPWCRPVVSERVLHSDTASIADGSVSVDSGCAMMIRNGRYGIDVSNSGLKNDDGPEGFIPNDTYAANDKNFTLITGINGSGKSTYLKQLAIIVVLAHCGSFVPAEQASIPVRDRLCTRIGNADDQEHNISTFMLEMKETAFICNSATEKSLILVDELGRATSNEDGVALAWSVSEYLLKKRAMTFFVTHYPQLSRLAEIYPTVQNVHMEASVAREDGGEIKYTHKVKSGACGVSKDYGVELAVACGWQHDVLDNARSIEREVEALMPDESVCAPQPPHLDTRTQAFNTLGEIGLNLKGFINDEHQQSYNSIRSDLGRLQENLVPRTNPQLTEKMDELLFREPRARRRAGTLQPVDSNSDYLASTKTAFEHRMPTQKATQLSRAESALAAESDDTSSLSSSSSDSDTSDSSSSSESTNE